MNRRTSYSVDELIAGIDNGGLPLKRCFLINELGLIVRDGGEEAIKAENKLAELLFSSEKSDRWIAVRYLLRVQLDKKTFEATKKALRDFLSDDNNQELLPDPDEV